MKKTMRFALILLFLAASTGIAAAPSPESGTIYGRVTDLDGNPLPGASVALMGSNLMGMNSHVTTATGQFFFPLLVPGVYEIRIEMPGFKIQLQRGLMVRSGRSTQLHIRLEETAVDEEVAVAASDQIIDTRNATNVIVTEADAFAGIPLARELFTLWTLIPGAVPDLAGDRRFVSVDGSSPRSQILYLEGAPINDPVTGLPLLHPMEDVIAEVVSLTAGKTGGLLRNRRRPASDHHPKRRQYALRRPLLLFDRRLPGPEARGRADRDAPDSASRSI